MTRKSANKYRDRAQTARDTGDFEKSAELFTLASYEYLGDANFDDVPIHNSTAFGDSIYCFQSAAIDFRKATDLDRSQNRCRQAILILEDVRDNISTYAAVNGLLSECIADLSIIGSLDDKPVSYAQVLSAYSNIDDSVAWQSEPIFQSTIQPLIELGIAVGDPISEEDQLEAIKSFQARVSLKSDRLPEYVSSI